MDLSLDELKSNVCWLRVVFVHLMLGILSMQDSTKALEIPLVVAKVLFCVCMFPDHKNEHFDL